MLDNNLVQGPWKQKTRPSCIHRLSPTSPTLKRLAEEVCDEHGCTLDMLRSGSRRRSLVRIRFEFMWRAYQTGLFSYPTIGRFLGKDHTSCINGVRRFKEMAPDDQTANSGFALPDGSRRGLSMPTRVALEVQDASCGGNMRMSGEVPT